MKRIGITGHQRLRPGSRDWAWIDAAMVQVARAEQMHVAISSLAAGADQRFARMAIDLGARLEVLVPCRHYAATFATPAARADYARLLDAADEIHALDRDACDEQAYMAAGECVVARCDLLIAVWDRRPAAGLGGTGDVVVYARQAGRQVIHIDPQSGTVSAL